jgi:hypothetical protein
MAGTSQNGDNSQLVPEPMDETPSTDDIESDERWVDPNVDYLGLVQEMREKWGNPDEALQGKLEAIEKAVDAMVGQSYALARRSVDDKAADLLLKDSAHTEVIEVKIEEDSDGGEDTQWNHRIELLYDDVLYLFHCGDKEGALISLERLLLLAPQNDDVQRFISVNEKKLLEVYEDVLGSFSLVPERVENPPDMPDVHREQKRFNLVMEHVNGENSIHSLFDILPWSPLESCAILSQLQRCGMLVTNSLQGYL